ncbi:hypothetical protein [Nonomuraea sp. CA-141351]|uniref:hypothetical protein n=1 Tax=Nonomuraea sp. CA-141351 TaxID=3239996 RepID=UPI003D8B13C0
MRLRRRPEARTPGLRTAPQQSERSSTIRTSSPVREWVAGFEGRTSSAFGN